MAKPSISSHTQSEGTGVRTPIMMSGLTISAFLPVEPRLMRHLAYVFINIYKYKTFFPPFFYIYISENYV